MIVRPLVGDIQTPGPHEPRILVHHVPRGVVPDVAVGHDAGARYVRFDRVVAADRRGLGDEGTRDGVPGAEEAEVGCVARGEDE